VVVVVLPVPALTPVEVAFPDLPIVLVACPLPFNDAVVKPDASGQSKNALEVRVGSDKVDFVVNGTVVHSEPQGALKTDGIYGIRVNHLLEVQIDDFGVSK